MDMTNNDIINANEVTSNAMTANTMVLNGGGFGAKALILNGSLFSTPLQIDSTSAVSVIKNAKYAGGQLSGIAVSNESVSSLNNVGVRRECQYTTTTATEDHITNYGVDYAIRTIPTGSSTPGERFKIGGDGVTYNTGDFDVVGNTLMYGVSRAKLGATDSFSVTDDTPGFSLLKFNVSNSSILSQIQHTFSNGLIPVADLVGSIGSSIKRFSNIWTGSINGLTPVGGVYSGISDGVLVGPGGVETSLLPLTGVGSLTVPANGFNIGDCYHLNVSGEIPIGDKDDVVTIKVCQNGICFATTSVDMEDSVGVSNFELECDICIRSIGVTGAIITNCEFSYNKSLLKDWKGNRHIELSTIDTTVATTLTVSATFSGDLNSTMQTKLFYLRKQY
jgi:hypothetical protein